MKHDKNADLIHLLDLSQELSQTSAKDANALTFLARPFVQTTLPHRDPGNLPEWIRRNGNLTLSIRPGWMDNPTTGIREPIGIPFGTIPRLLLFWLTTEAKRTGEKKIFLGDNISNFMRKIGLDPRQGGKRSDTARLKTQMSRLFDSVISFHQINTNETMVQKNWLNMNITSFGNLWELSEFSKYRKDDVLPEGYIVLGEEFFQALTHSAVPLDLRIINEFKQSPLALDLYAFLSYRGFTQASKNTPLIISWEQLHQQCGSDYKDVKDFAKKAKEVIKKIQALSRNVEIENLRGRLKITSKLTIVK